MRIHAQPEILPPRSGPGSRLFTDENLDVLSHVLDDWLRIPGTSVRFGLDAIVGLVPGIGDVLGGLASCVLLLAAWLRGVPYVTLARMTFNVGVEVVVGSIPLFGDMFDIAWKANRRNYKLLTRHVEEPRKHTWKDWAFLLTIAAAVLIIFALPLLMLAWVLAIVLRGPGR